jgi:hypothetical protein
MTKALITGCTVFLAACSHAPARPFSTAVASAEPAPVPVAAPKSNRPAPTRATPDATADADADADADDRRTEAALEKALALYGQFIERAGDDASYREAVARSRERIADIEQTLIFLRQGMKERQR